jgi:hypothetical protein
VDKKVLAYTMSLVSSLSMTSAGLFTTLPAFYASGFDVLSALSDTRHNRFVCTFFGTFCCLDILYGLIFYPKQIDVLTGWVHHSVYLWLMYFLHSHHIQGGFSLFLIEELPTFLLALGNVSREWRTNFFFGASFFVTRLVWHGFLLVKFLAARQQVEQHLWPLVLLTLLLHLYWFYGYVRQQLRRAAKQKKPKAD